MARNKKPAGATERPRPKGQPKVSELISNTTVIAAPVNPKRAAGSKKVEMIQAGDLGAVAAAAKTEGEFTLNTVKDGAPSEVQAVMRYGRTSPDTVLEDFEADSLVAKVEQATPPDGAGEIERRVLLDQRLQSAAVADFLKEMTKNAKFKAALKDPAQRVQLLAALEAEIQHIEEVAKKLRDEENLKKTEEEG